LADVADMYRSLANQSNWYDLKCLENGKLRTVEDISNEVLNMVKPLLK